MESPVSVQDPSLFINRELSLLAFQKRVLEEAKDERVPLLERLRFLCITSTNLDEFFEIRVSGLKEQAAMGAAPTGPDNLAPQAVLDAISPEAHALVAEQYRVLNDVLLPALAQEGIVLLRRSRWTPKVRTWVRNFFKHDLKPLLTPLGLDPTHPFPRVLNKSLNFIITLEGKDAFYRNTGLAVLQAPRALPRVVRLPPEIAEAPWGFVLLSSIIHAFVGTLFPGMKVKGCHQFRVTRNSDLFIDEEEIDDLLRALEGELSQRQYGRAVRLEVSDKCPLEAARFLLSTFVLGEKDLYQVQGPVNLNRLSRIVDEVERPDLKYPPFVPGLPRQLANAKNLFSAIAEGDILLHHPYESFSPVLELLRQAAQDKDVLAVYQTLYRTGQDSLLVQLLIEAARAGKEVTVIIELKARFDEKDNIDLATRLTDAGAHVVYGVVGHKVHAKMMLILRREKGDLRRYVHMGTGNYHERTTRLYTDYSFFSAKDTLGDDVHKLFLEMTGLGEKQTFKAIVDSPFRMSSFVQEMIAKEAQAAREGLPSGIVAKMNALADPPIIESLYAASSAGVKIELIVRGICALRPGIPGVSENIRVRSVVGRFLEHSRVWCFTAGGKKPRIYLSSADWLPRNLYRRVEIGFPIQEPRLQKRIMDEMGLYLADTADSWFLQKDGVYARLDGGPAMGVQERLLARLTKSP